MLIRKLRRSLLGDCPLAALPAQLRRLYTIMSGTPGELTIISFDGCPYAHRTRLICAEKGIPRKVVNIDLQNKPDWFLKLNPAGKVPVIQHGDHVVPESLAINEYVDEVFDGPKLFPEDPYKKAMARVWTFRLADPLTTALYPVAMTKPGAEAFAKLTDNLLAKVKDVEAGLRQTSESGPYFLGEQYSVVDVSLWPSIARLDVVKSLHGWSVPDTEEFSRFHAYAKALRERPSSIEEHYDEAGMEAYVKARLAAQ